MDDRREFFRIEDMAFVGCTTWRSDQTSVPEYFPEFRFLSLQGEIENLEKDSQELYQKLDDELAKKLIEIQNRKLDLVIKYLSIKDISASQMPPQQVIISEGGVGFQSDKQFQNGALVAVAIVFTPSYLPIFTKAEVIGCRPDNESHFFVHTNFIQLPEETRQKLARHLLMQQARQTREAKDSES